MTRRSQLFRDLGKQVPGRGNSRCKGPEARMNLPCLGKGKKVTVIALWKTNGGQIGAHKARDVGKTDHGEPHQLRLEVHIFCSL